MAQKKLFMRAFAVLRVRSFYVLTGLTLLLALTMRLYFFLRQGGEIHPDEVFQYLEPAQWKVFGYGQLAWEFEHGARNFALSGFYSHFLRLGAWLQLSPFAVHRALFFLDAMMSLALLPAMWRLGLQIEGIGLWPAWILALSAAIFPIFSYFAPHTLSESHVVVLIAWGTLLWLELQKDSGVQNVQPAPGWRDLCSAPSFAAGLLLGLAFVIRYAAAVFIVVPALDVLLAPRQKKALTFYAGLLLPVLLIALVDWYAWGFPLATFVHYVDRNVLHGYAATHGKMPWWYYFSQLRALFGPAVYLLLGGLLVAVYKKPRLSIAALLPLLAYSLFKHKELRFILPVFPLLIVATAAGFAQIGKLLRARNTRVIYLYIYVFIWFFMIFWTPLRQAQTWSRGQNRGFFTALDYVGRQADATGLLIDTTRSHTGGYTLLRRNIPFMFAYGDLLLHRAYNYVAVTTPGMIRFFKSRKDFRMVGRDQGVFLFRRLDK